MSQYNWLDFEGTIHAPDLSKLRAARGLDQGMQRRERNYSRTPGTTRYWKPTKIPVTCLFCISVIREP